MLVVMRKSGQSLVIGKDIEIQILEVQANGVKIGIAAPKGIPVLRKEILSEAKIANRESAVIALKVNLSDLKQAIEKKPKFLFCSNDKYNESRC